MRIQLGEGGARARKEDFLDGQFTIVSRDGLHANQRAILAVLPKGKTGRALVINSEYAVLGLALRTLNPDIEIVCHYEDAWMAELAKQTIAAHPDAALQVSVAADPPDGPWQYIVLPLERRGIADLVRERVRMAASQWLAPQGLLITSSDTKGERFIRDEVKKAFGALHIAPEEQRRGAVAYVARKPAKQLVAPPHSWSTFTVREAEQTLTFHSRLAVFCHDRLDPGTRALLSFMQADRAARILDLGCGSGVVGIIAAMRNPNARVTFVDSSARAVESTRRNLADHKLTARTDDVLLSADARSQLASSKFDLVVTNPPYYGNWRIAELFLHTARELLESGGRLQLVTKSPDWYVEQLESGFSDLHTDTKAGYSVLTARRT